MTKIVDVHYLSRGGLDEGNHWQQSNYFCD